MAFQIFLNGLYGSLSLMLLVVGLALMFSIMQIVFLSYGFLFVAAAYVVWFLTKIQGWGYLPAAVVAIAIAIILGIALERGLFRRHRGFLLPCMVVSLGLNMVLETGLWLGVDAMGYGLGEKVISQFSRGVVHIFGATISWERVWVMLAGAAVLIIGMIFIKTTKTGKAMRAVSQDPGAASVLGVNLNKLTYMTMAIVSVMAGVYGILIAPMHPLSHDAGLGPILLGFLIVITGGAGSLGGAILTAFIIGFAGSVATSLGSPYISSVVVYMLILVILIIRPQGIFGYHIHIE